METGKKFVPTALIIILAMFATGSFGCWNMPQDKSTGNYVKEERTISSFSKLDIGGAFKVYLYQGDQEKVVVEADDKEIKEIVTEVVGNELRIYTKPGWGPRFHEMSVYVTFRNLDYIDLSGAVEVAADKPLNFSELKMDISGAAEVNLEFKAEKYVAEFSGASEIHFRGSCKSGDLELSGASEFDAEGMEFQDLNIEVSGASEAKVFATGNLYIDASGASSIRYKGNPKVSVDESGASSIKPI